MFQSNYSRFLILLLLVCSDNALESAEKLFEKFGKHKIVYPKVLEPRETQKFKRSTTSTNKKTDSLFITLDSWMIKSDLNDDILISPNYVSQWIHSADTKKPNIDKSIQSLHTCVALKGSVRSVKNSTALLTICDNDIFGLITVDGKSFFLQPVNTNGSHALYRTKMPAKLMSIMDDYSPHFKNSSVHNNEDSTIHGDNNGNFVIEDAEDSQDDKPCMALEIGKHGQKYGFVKSSLCGKKNRSRRHLKKTTVKHEYPDDNDNRPYRVVHSCFEKNREKRALTICDTAEYYNMTSDVARMDYLDQFLSISPRMWSNSNDNDDKNLFMDDENDATSETQSTSEQSYYARNLRQIPPRRPMRVAFRWAKIVIGVDYDVIRFHGQRTEQYVFSMFNIVSTLFKHISQNYVLKIVIMKMLLYQNPQDSAVYGGDTKYPLYSVNMWNRNLWTDAVEKHDMAVWYTHFRITEDISTSPGAFMCQKEWSCLLIEDVGWLSAIKIAHGIGHLIGLSHDGDLALNNNCALESLLKTTIMSKYIPANMPVPVWSECSIREYVNAIQQYPCLERPPVSYMHTTFMAGTFSLDEQCRIEFGDGWVYCNRISVPDPCNQLWCNKAAGTRRSCMTRQTATLEGTSCGRGKRCVNHTCEDATRPGIAGRPPPRPTAHPHTQTPVPTPPGERPIYPSTSEDGHYSQLGTPRPYSPPGKPPSYPFSSPSRPPSSNPNTSGTPPRYPASSPSRPPSSNPNTSGWPPGQRPSYATPPISLDASKPNQLPPDYHRPQYPQKPSEYSDPTRPGSDSGQYRPSTTTFYPWPNSTPGSSGSQHRPESSTSSAHSSSGNRPANPNPGTSFSSSMEQQTNGSQSDSWPGSSSSSGSDSQFSSGNRPESHPSSTRPLNGSVSNPRPDRRPSGNGSDSHSTSTFESTTRGPSSSSTPLQWSGIPGSNIYPPSGQSQNGSSGYSSNQFMSNPAYPSRPSQAYLPFHYPTNVGVNPPPVMANGDIGAYMPSLGSSPVSGYPALYPPAYGAHPHHDQPPTSDTFSKSDPSVPSSIEWPNRSNRSQSHSYPARPTQGQQSPGGQPPSSQRPQGPSISQTSYGYPGQQQPLRPNYPYGARKFDENSTDALSDAKEEGSV